MAARGCHGGNRRMGELADLARRFIRGFTLIELLVVVAIMTVLIGILIPALQGARRQAKQTVCASNMRQIGLAAVVYANANDEYYPPSTHGSQNAAWLRSMLPQAKDTSVYRCPEDRSDDWYVVGQDPGMQLINDRRASYAMNIYFSPLFVPPAGAPDRTPRYGYVRRHQIHTPGAVVHFGEYVETDGPDLYADHIHADQWLPNALTGVATSKPEESVAMSRHRGRANYTFADGHVALHPFEATFKIDEATGEVEIDKWDPGRR